MERVKLISDLFKLGHVRQPPPQTPRSIQTYSFDSCYIRGFETGSMAMAHFLSQYPKKMIELRF